MATFLTLELSTETSPTWLIAAGVAAQRLEPGPVTNPAARDGVIVPRHSASLTSWPAFATAKPTGPSMVLLPAAGGWDVPAARTASGLHAAGRRVHLVLSGDEPEEVTQWLQNIPRSRLHDVAASGAAGDPGLYVSAGVMAGLIGVTDPMILVVNQEGDQLLPPEGDRPVLVCVEGVLTEAVARGASALRAIHDRVLLVTRDSAAVADPWLARVDVVIAEPDGSCRWRPENVIEPSWRTAEEAALREEEEAAKRQAALVEQRSRAEQVRKAQERAAQVGRDQAARAAADEVARAQVLRVLAREKAEAPPLRATPPDHAATPPSSASQPRSNIQSDCPCAWCGKTVKLGPTQSMTLCGSCQRTSALCRCPKCSHEGMARVKAKQVICASCGHRSDAGGPGLADKLIVGGATVAYGGCVLWLVMFIAIPIVLFLVFAIAQAFQK